MHVAAGGKLGRSHSYLIPHFSKNHRVHVPLKVIQIRHLHSNFQGVSLRCSNQERSSKVEVGIGWGEVKSQKPFMPLFTSQRLFGNLLLQNAPIDLKIEFCL